MSLSEALQNLINTALAEQARNFQLTLAQALADAEAKQLLAERDLLQRLRTAVLSDITAELTGLRVSAPASVAPVASAPVTTTTKASFDADAFLDNFFGTPPVTVVAPAPAPAPATPATTTPAATTPTTEKGRPGRRFVEDWRQVKPTTLADRVMRINRARADQGKAKLPREVIEQNGYVVATCIALEYPPTPVVVPAVAAPVATPVAAPVADTEVAARNEYEFEGPTAEDALRVASTELGVSQDSLEYRIVDLGSQGVLGFGARPARVQVWITVPEDVESAHAPAAPVAPVAIVEDPETIKQEALAAAEAVAVDLRVQAAVQTQTPVVTPIASDMAPMVATAEAMEALAAAEAVTVGCGQLMNAPRQAQVDAASSLQRVNGGGFL